MTISILVLLALIAVGLLTLSTISVRSSSADLARQEARANARLGVMLALGELQRSLGPDRRVSATAGILDSSPDSDGIDGVQHPHWLTVWSTEWKDGKTPWTRDDEAGGLEDRRTTDNWDPKEEVENFVVSGNEGGRERRESSGGWLDARTERLTGRDSVEVVGEGSVNEDDDRVVVKRVPTKTGPIRGLENGGYGFWVGDLNVRANVAKGDAHHKTAVGNSAAGAVRMVHAQDVGEDMIDGFGSIEAEEAKRILSHETLSLLSGVDKDGMKDNFHATTTYSRSVLANVRDGGLQRDLTPYASSTSRRCQLACTAASTGPRSIKSTFRYYTLDQVLKTIKFI